MVCYAGRTQQYMPPTGSNRCSQLSSIVLTGRSRMLCRCLPSTFASVVSIRVLKLFDSRGIPVITLPRPFGTLSVWQDGVDPQGMSRVAIEDAYGESPPPPPPALLETSMYPKAGLSLAKPLNHYTMRPPDLGDLPTSHVKATLCYAMLCHAIP